MIKDAIAFSCRYVALLAEGVDRNFFRFLTPNRDLVVALLAEGVDRNRLESGKGIRRGRVALLAEGVDRNSIAFTALCRSFCRPPRGGRG